MRVRILGRDLFIGSKETPWYAMRQVAKFPALSVINGMIQEDVIKGNGDVIDHVAVIPEVAAHLFGCGGFDVYALRDSQKKPDSIRIERTAISTLTRKIPVVIVPKGCLCGEAIATRNANNEIL